MADSTPEETTIRTSVGAPADHRASSDADWNIPGCRAPARPQRVVMPVSGAMAEASRIPRRSSSRLAKMPAPGRCAMRSAPSFKAHEARDEGAWLL